MKISILIFLLLPGSFSFAQADTAQQKAAFAFADSVFSRAGFTFEINDIVVPEDLQRIMQKIDNAITANRQWAEEYIKKNLTPGGTLPYDARLGVTREEFEKVRSMDKLHVKLQPARSEKMSVTRQDSILNFKDLGNFRFLDYLTFDLKAREVTYGSDTLSFFTEGSTPRTAPFGKWHGYSWKFEIADQQNNLQPDLLTGRTVEIDLGRTGPGERIFLRLKLVQLEMGQPKMNMDLLGFIKGNP